MRALRRYVSTPILLLAVLAASGLHAESGDRDGDGILDSVDVCPHVADPAQLDGDGDRVGNACDRIVQDLSAAAFLAHGAASPSLLGYGLAAGDIDDDGVDDLIAGAPLGYGTYEGVAYVLSGPLAGTVDLAANVPGTTLRSSGDIDYGAAAAVGDLDQDGRDDLVVGAPSSWGYCDCDTCFGGGLTLVSGAAATSGPLVDTYPPVAMHYISTCAERIGGHLALGDVDGDGTLDLLASPLNGGYAYLYRDDPIDFPQFRADVEMWGSWTAPDEAGRDLAIGDLDGDGIEDMVIGAPGSAGPGGVDPDTGALYVVRGVAAGMPITLNLESDATATVHGDAAGDRAGQSIAIADWNGDGLDDILVGAPNADGPAGALRTDAGAAYLVLGRASIAQLDGLRLADAALLRIDGDTAAARLGTTVALGDLDGDAAVDAFLLGDIGSGPAGDRPAAGGVRVLPRSRIPNAPRIDLALVAPSWIVHGSASGDWLAVNARPLVATLTGGALPDLVLGAAWSDGLGATRPDAGAVGVLRQPDRDGDGREDGLDCLPDDPASIGLGPTGFSSYFDPVDPTFVWSAVPGAEHYAFYRGTIAGRWRDDATCLAGNLAQPQSADAAVPAPGTGFWYDSAAESATCRGPLGSGSRGVARQIPPSCP